MSGQKENKLNWIQQYLPEGLPVNSGWLEQEGYSRSLRSKYVAHGWLEQVAHGVYRRPPAKLSASGPGQSLRWEQVIISLQTLLDCPYTVGGRTALELQGLAHYLSASGPREVHLYGKEAKPGWVSRLKLETQFVFHNAEKLFRNFAAPTNWPTRGAPQSERERNLIDGSLVQQRWGHWDWPLILSSPERAILEMLAEVPQRETFHQADVLMEGLVNLRPARVHTLLVDCRSVKVKRLFLWFAERHHHAWLSKLDREGIDLGHGKRALAPGGRLDSKFNITVPEDMHARS
jgi:hypothetical protein